MTDAIEAGARALCRYTWGREFSGELLDNYVDANWQDHIAGSKACIEAAIASGALVPATEVVKIKNRIDSHLNAALCEMKPGWDDSISGFNDAWDIVRKVFDLSPACVEYVVVPREPTPDMRIAGGIAWAEALPSSETYVDAADACYKAMLNAATRTGGEK